MICSNCGSEIPGNVRFCGKCGTVMPTPTPPAPRLAQAQVHAPASATPPGAGAAETLVGRTIEGKYQIEAQLGVGGMGTVYRATRLLIGDAVAVKVLHPAHVADPQSTERFRREAQAAARLKHPNAVSIYDFGVSGEGLVYLVMELVEGRSLRQIIKGQGPLPPAAALEVLNQACAALDEAHRQNIVHRDLKPDNLIVNETLSGLRVKVLDFGIAKLRDLAATDASLTQTGSVMGTPHYMSPEQCLGEELDHRSDIYSLGVVLYEMFAGVVPFNSPTATAVVVQHVNQAPPSLRAINLSITPAIEAVVLRAMAKQRDARPQMAGALAQELAAAVTGQTAAPPGYRAPGVQPLGTATPRSGAQPVSSGSFATPTPPTGPASGMQPTMAMRTPRSGATPIAGMPFPRHATPAGGVPFPSGPTSAAPAAPIQAGNKKLLPILLAAVLVLALGAAATWFFLKPKNEASNNKSANNAPDSVAAPTGMAYVPSGALLMGNDAGEITERPAHKVAVKPFFIDLYEVSCEEYQRFVLATNHRAPVDWNGNRYPTGAARRPVTGVNWDDATAYAAWLNKRLPTETEWEFAARGTEGRRYPWSNEWKSGYANADSTSLGHVSDVGAYASGTSPFGLFDMVGNAWEWTASDLTAYPGGQLEKPPAERLAADLKVIRGGCYKSDLSQATTTFRLGWPGRDSDGGHTNYAQTGFRCAKDVPAPGAQ